MDCFGQAGPFGCHTGRPKLDKKRSPPFSSDIYHYQTPSREQLLRRRSALACCVQMREELGMTPDLKTFHILMDTFAKEGDVERYGIACLACHPV